jgi:hypothetical protein
MLLKAFFITTTEFSKKEEVKKVINVNIVLAICSSSDERVATNAGLLLFEVVGVYSSRDSDEKIHKDFSWMKKKGILDEIHSTFKSCLFDKVKRLIGVSMINIDRGCSCFEKTNEIISWLVDHTSGITGEWNRTTTLIGFGRVVYRFLYVVYVI